MEVGSGPAQGLTLRVATPCAGLKQTHRGICFHRRLSAVSFFPRAGARVAVHVKGLQTHHISEGRGQCRLALLSASPIMEIQ